MEEHRKRARDSQETSDVHHMEIDVHPSPPLRDSRPDVESNSSPGSKSSSSSDSRDYLSDTMKRISEEQEKLSYQDRNAINEEVHGVACNAQNESPRMLGFALTKLSSELDGLVRMDWRKNSTTTSSLSAGYLLSQRNCGSDAYINKPSFRLRFLRTENFDVRKAAIRLMKFMNLVLEVFGAFALCRPILLTDFKRNEMKALQTGWLQLLPFRDRSGRRLVFWTGQMGFQYDAILRIKIAMYIMLAGTRDTESQQKGIVCTIYPGKASPNSGSTNDKFKITKSQLTYLSYCKRAQEALPVKICAIHYCIISDETKRLNRIQKIALGMAAKLASSMMPRLRIHIDGVTGIQNILSTYGISVGLIPTTVSGAVKTTEFKKWLRLQRLFERLELADENVPYIECPGSNDVVFRAGSSMIANPGNVMFRSLVESKVHETIRNSESDVSRRLSKKTKEEIATEIMEEVSQRRNARFLRWDNDTGCWVEFGDMDQVRSKIAIAYRDLKLRTLKSRQKDAQSEI